jgi:hypothetical protein
LSGGLGGAIAAALGRPDSLDRAIIGLVEESVDALLTAAAAGPEPPTDVLFVSSANVNCGTGDAIRLWNERPVIEGKRALIVPSAWTDSEIAALRWTFTIGEPILRATPSFSRGWVELQERYGRGQAATFLARFGTHHPTAIYTGRRAVLDALGEVRQ